MIDVEKIEVFDKIIEFLDNELYKSNSFHYSNGENQFREGYKSCLKSILNVIEDEKYEK